MAEYKIKLNGKIVWEGFADDEQQAKENAAYELFEAEKVI